MYKFAQNMWLPRIIMVYMLLALLWWSWLLFKNNSELTKTKLENLQLYSNVFYKTDHYDISQLEVYDKIIKRHKRQRLMIIGEALVFGFTLILGMTMVSNAYRKQLENSSRQNNFLLSITHELKSPLASIQLILETLSKRVLEKKQVEELSTDGWLESKRLEKQINNLLLATKLDKAYQFNFQKENIIPIIKEIVRKQKQNTPDASIEFNPKDDEISLNIDKEGFHSIINNVLENAIKYSPTEKKVNIEITTTNPKEIFIRIFDNGIGIPELQRDKIFEQFYRAQNEETRNTKGTGLGLYIVKKLMEAHRGNVTVKENQGGGSIFILQFLK
ncbi:MAG TPA: HAMP domain-containing sensor histidine kinase [Saprospiraceae bacterium]|nr:HAMP domain-containing sensor histidine kinase [Saprospiraceae bacterium]